MQILVTNDDGINAPGLAALAERMQELGEVTVIAPDRNWSISGHAKTFGRPLRIQPVDLLKEIRSWALDGSPADCVAFAMLGFIKNDVDLVVSGINPHANVGSDVTYSGTVTSAFEGALFGRKSIAVSLDSTSPHNSPEEYVSAAEAAAVVAKYVLSNDLPDKVVLNVNVPDRPYADLKGIQITRLGKRVYRDALIRRMDPSEQPYYWMGGEPPTGVPEQGTDIGALAEGYVSICPLQLDMSALQHHQTFQSWNITLGNHRKQP